MIVFVTFSVIDCLESAVTVTEVLVLRPLLEDRERITESIRILVPPYLPPYSVLSLYDLSYQETGLLNVGGNSLICVEWSELKALVNEVNELHIPAPADMLRRLNNVVREADECAHVAGHLARRLSLIGFVLRFFISFHDCFHRHIFQPYQL